MYENHHTIYKVCPNCGAHLDPGERCDCQTERMHPLPRDGLRATCPYFRQRRDYQGMYEIECEKASPDGKKRSGCGEHFLDRQERDAEYERRCCHGGDCNLRDDIQKKTDDNLRRLYYGTRDNNSQAL